MKKQSACLFSLGIANVRDGGAGADSIVPNGASNLQFGDQLDTGASGDFDLGAFPGLGDLAAGYFNTHLDESGYVGLALSLRKGRPIASHSGDVKSTNQEIHETPDLRGQHV